MTKLMQQLQAWADEGRYTFPLTEGGKRGFERKGLTHLLTADEQYGVGYVLDGTIQVWRPVEHYPLIENNKPVILWRKGIRNGIVAVWSLEFGSCFTDCEWRDFKTQEIIEDIEDYTHWMPFEPPQEVSHA